MAKRINITLPDKTVNVLDRVAKKGDRSRFIDRAVLHYIETAGRQNLREQLKAMEVEREQLRDQVAELEVRFIELSEEALKKKR